MPEDSHPNAHRGDVIAWLVDDRVLQRHAQNRPRVGERSRRTGTSVPKGLDKATHLGALPLHPGQQRSLENGCRRAVPGVDDHIDLLTIDWNGRHEMKHDASSLLKAHRMAGDQAVLPKREFDRARTWLDAQPGRLQQQIQPKHGAINAGQGECKGTIGAHPAHGDIRQHPDCRWHLAPSTIDHEARQPRRTIPPVPVHCARRHGRCGGRIDHGPDGASGDADQCLRTVSKQLGPADRLATPRRSVHGVRTWPLQWRRRRDLRIADAQLCLQERTVLHCLIATT